MRMTVTAIALTAALAGCGSSGGSNGGHPDTGFGANQPIPATETCTAFCQREVDCGIELCDEDTGTTTEQQFHSLLISECESLCTDSLIQSNVPSTAWSCLFTDSCRQVYGADACHVGASYSCMAN